jgi:hypothetical protein
VPSDVVIDAVTALGEAFGRQVTEATVGAYDVGLRGLTDSQIAGAAAVALQRCKFMPVPAELRELAVGAGQSFDAMSERAFLTLSETVRRKSDMDSVRFADGLINATVRILGGWEALYGETMTAERFDVWFRKDFLACYARLAKTGASPELCGYLVGGAERENAHWDGREMRHGVVYTLERFAPVQEVGSPYTPALPAPPVTQRKCIGMSREFLKLANDGRLTPATPAAPAAP